ncbi:MAG: GNAT family N-acetyltransferase [Pseudomonadales bacterium]|nr:GNAT family N-acetyltransferase [Halioglobus sp.]MCP5121411.1 GNAT family N-acetyltransferase [Pseudomonadales bacterium]MCP5193250.1 GNAT family N-acetyltransferase [Pseudomonadales bacterium]
MREHRLRKVFEPQSVALVGASGNELSVGGQLLGKLVESDFQGALYPINPRYDTLRELRCYASLTAVGRPIELAVIAIPAPAIAGVLQECGACGVGAAIVISAGFGEVGPQGQALQDEIVAIARRNNITLVGPNCLGIIRPAIGLNASFARSKVAGGQVAMVAQSGAFCSALLDWGDARGFGFSAVASLGATADVGFGEVLDYLALDPRTKSILLYIEGITDARAFLSGLRAAARLKPVIVVKSGRSERGTRAALSHTGAKMGGDRVFDAAIKRAGAVRVVTVSQWFATAQMLASGTRVEGARLAILTNGGGPGVMAADRAADVHVPLADLSAESVARLSAALPPHWSHSNPVDILGNASSETYKLATAILLDDENVDGVLVLLSPQGMTDPGACAEGVIAAMGDSRKPVLTCWLGEKLVRRARRYFSDAGVPSFNSPEAGVDAFGFLAAYRRNQQALLQAPPPLSKKATPDVAGARYIMRQALAERRFSLSSAETRDVLRAFHMPVRAAHNAGAEQATGNGRHAPGIMMTITRDPIFGPVISFGPGGTTVDLDMDNQIALPPLNDYLARELIESTRTFGRLRHLRRLADDDIDKLVEALRRISEMACELPEIQTLEINPLHLDEQGVMAEAARISLAEPCANTSRYCHMAIHPYPQGLELTWQLADGTPVLVRPIRPEDAKTEREFVDSLSSESKYFRFLNHMDKISPLLLARFTQIDYDREMALVALVGEHTPQARIIGVVRYIGNPDNQSCEFALTVADAWQKRGLGSQLMERLMSIARERGLQVMEGDVLAQNTKMLRLCAALGFHTVRNEDDPEVVIVRRQL